MVISKGVWVCEHLYIAENSILLQVREVFSLLSAN